MTGPTLNAIAYKRNSMETCQVLSSREDESARMTRTTWGRTIGLQQDLNRVRVPTVSIPAAPMPATPRPTIIMTMLWAPVERALPKMKKAKES
jgi:hypothetical protein